jgi:hypothetical protein
VAQNTQNFENFIGRYDKLSRAAKREVSRENKNIVVHQGSLAYKTALTECKSVHGFRRSVCLLNCSGNNYCH